MIYVVQTLSIAFACLFFVSCTDSEFTGNNSSNSKKDSPASDSADGPDGSDLGNEDSSDGQSDLGSDDGLGNTNEEGYEEEEIIDCEDDDAVVEDDETFDFKGAAEVRAFVNDLCEAGVPTAWRDQGAIRADPKTGHAICRLKGFEKMSNHTQRNFSSPGDNHIAWWDEDRKTFTVHFPATKHNFWFDLLSCKGKLHDSCHDDEAKLKCDTN